MKKHGYSITLAALGVVLLLVGPAVSIQTALTGRAEVTIPASFMIPAHGSMSIAEVGEPNAPRETMDLVARWQADGQVSLVVAIHHGGFPEFPPEEFNSSPVDAHFGFSAERSRVFNFTFVNRSDQPVHIGYVSIKYSTFTWPYETLRAFLIFVGIFMIIISVAILFRKRGHNIMFWKEKPKEK